MKPAGATLYGVGVVLFIAFAIWGVTGVYTSQLVPFFLLGAAAIAAVVIGAKLNKDPNPNKAVEWKPSVTPTVTQTMAPEQPMSSSGAATENNEGDAEMQSSVDRGDMMNCPKCSNETRIGAGFCGFCGAKLGVAPLLAPPPPPPAPEAPPAVAAIPTEPEQPTAAQSGDSGMITPPPGMITPPPGMLAPAEVIAEVPARPVSDVYFAMSPGVPFVSPPSEDLDATRATVRRRGGSPWRLVLPDGSNVVVDGTILIGRDAAASAKWPDAQLLSVNDTTQSVSKTHAVIQSDEQGLWVTDLNSTNGVIVTRPGGSEAEAEGDERVLVDAGCDIELGDFIIQVEKD